jgi:hypothetical protein
MLLAVATCASTARWSFLRTLTCGVNGATLQENAPEASCRLVFRWQSRGPVEDDGNGHGLSFAGLGICGHQEALPSPYIVGKEGESRDSWRRRVPSFLLAYMEGAEAC